jgi:hypothetical protein
MRYKFALILCVTALTACTYQRPVKSVRDVPIPPDLSSAWDYDSEHNTSYETFAKQLMVSLLYSLGMPKPGLDVEFFVLPDRTINESKQINFYATELAKLGWTRDEEGMGIVNRWWHQSRRGRQTFVTTYMSIPNSYDALAVRLLYPVYK